MVDKNDELNQFTKYEELKEKYRKLNNAHNQLKYRRKKKLQKIRQLVHTESVEILAKRDRPQEIIEQKHKQQLWFETIESINIKDEVSTMIDLIYNNDKQIEIIKNLKTR